jgi:hypothetical protein
MMDEGPEVQPVWLTDLFPLFSGIQDANALVRHYEPVGGHCAGPALIRTICGDERPSLSLRTITLASFITLILSSTTSFIRDDLCALCGLAFRFDSMK